jgi:hypothetical protein
MGTVAKHVEMLALPPGSPGLFRCAAAGYMAGVFRDAGLRNVTEKEVAAPVQFKSPEEYFTFMNEIAPPVVAGIAKADEPTRAKIKDVVLGLAASELGRRQDPLQRIRDRHLRREVIRPTWHFKEAPPGLGLHVGEEG